MTEGLTSTYFPNYVTDTEQGLLEDLIVESVGIYGINCYYIARDMGNYDKIYGTDDSSSYSQNWMIAIYLKNVMGYIGDREFMSKFAGLEIRDQLTFSVPRRTFKSLIGDESGFSRPREGDLIWFPFHKKCFQIKFVNNFEMFYQIGSLNTWEITAELFEYSGETFDTGIDEIDALQKVSSNNLLDWSFMDENSNPLLDENGDYLMVDAYDIESIEPLDDTMALSNNALNILDFSDNDPFVNSFSHKI